MDIRRAISTGQLGLPRNGQVQASEHPSLPYMVVDAAGQGIEPVNDFLRDLALSDVSPLSCRSYGHDLLRWWRLLELVQVPWDQASRSEIELLVGYLRSSPNPQRERQRVDVAPAGSVNLRTGKPSLPSGYTSSTINHSLSVLSTFYAFHRRFGRGPLLNPVPVSPERRRLLAHRSPLQPQPQTRRAPLRQKITDQPPRSLPDPLWDELFRAMGTDRDRALLSFYVSSGARAGELLDLQIQHVDWGEQRIWVVSKGSRALEAVPASPEAFRYLGRYLDQFGVPLPGQPVWRALRGETRPLSYWALRRVVQRANARLGTNWTLHDLRHTAAARLAADPRLTLPEVQTILRHQRLSTTQRYLQPRVEELFKKLHDHYAHPAPARQFPSGYDAGDVEAVFGGG